MLKRKEAEKRPVGFVTHNKRLAKKEVLLEDPAPVLIKRRNVQEGYSSFMSDGEVSCGGLTYPIKIL